MRRRTFLALLGIGTASAAFANTPHSDNSVWISDAQVATFLSVSAKIEKVKRVVGYGNFNILSFDAMLKIATRYSQVGGAFTKAELDFIEEIFYANPNEHGFYGKKTVPSLSTAISEKDVEKIDGTGHYLFRGRSQTAYNRALKDVGSSLILTSGIRGVPKQMNLFFNKIRSTGGNISLASNSIAPPAYSYHSIGDFDVGKKGWGYKNFTVSFVRTREFWRLRQLSYISIRYTTNNTEGVRFEPWHVKII